MARERTFSVPGQEEFRRQRQTDDLVNRFNIALSKVVAMNSAPAPGGNSIEVGRRNRCLVLDAVRVHEPISRPELARLTGLTTATIANIVGKLQRDHLVEEVGSGRSTGGRKPGLLQLERTSRLAIAVDLAATDLMVALTNVKGEVLRRSKREIATDVDLMITRMVDAIREMMGCPEVGGASIVGIGVTAPGLIDHAAGTIVKSVRLGWYQVPLKSLLQRHFEVPVFVGKDTTSALLGEQWYGTARDANNLIYVWVGTGIAVGLLVDGRVYTGATGMAGELGHTSIECNGTPCRCGNQGCLEGLASLEAIASKVSSRVSPGEGEATLDAARAVDLRAREIVREAGKYLGVGIANLINLFNPERIIIGGQITQEDKEFVDAAIETAKRRALSEPANSVTITMASFGQDAGLIGAAALVWRELLRTL